MLSVFLSILSVYFFVLIGFTAKKAFGEQIDDRSFSVMSVYFFQPMLVFWGIFQRPIDMSLFMAPFVYGTVIVIALAITSLIAPRIFSDQKHRSIGTIACTIANTGNLPVPVGLALFGAESVAYMTMINLMNVILFYTVGVYIYSRGEFSVRQSLLNIFKLPILWCGAFALLLSSTGVELSPLLEDTLTMAAHASIVVQVIIFGLYLGSVSLSKIEFPMLAWTTVIKFLLIPSLGLLLLPFFPLSTLAVSCLLLQFVMPLAVNNINIASLYRCKPTLVTEIVFVTSLLALMIVPVYIVLMDAITL